MKRQLLSGCAAIVSQICSIGLVLWLIKDQLGAESVGLWSLVLSTFSIVRFSEFGLGQTLIHYAQVAKTEEATEGHPFEAYFRTAFTVTVIVATITSAAIFFPVRQILNWMVDPVYKPVLDQVLPIMAVSLVCGVANRVPAAALNGLGYFWYGQIAIILGAIGYGVLAVMLIEDRGLIGIAIGHFTMTAVTLFFGLLAVLLVRYRQTGRIMLGMLCGFNMAVWRKIYRLGLSFQATTMMFFFIEPISRLALTEAGGLQMTGYYEMASRFVTTPREIIARSFGFMSGRFSELSEKKDPARLLAYYRREKRRMTWLMLGMALAIAIAILPVADYWVGERHPFFLFSVGALCIGWLSTVPALVPWYWGIGTGQNRYNLRAVGLMLLIALCGSGIALLFSAPSFVPVFIGIAILVAEITLLRAVGRTLSPV